MSENLQAYSTAVNLEPGKPRTSRQGTDCQGSMDCGGMWTPGALLPMSPPWRFAPASAGYSSEASAIPGPGTTLGLGMEGAY